MTTVVVLAMHGMPPKDFPRQETSELFSLQARLAHPSGPERAQLEARHAALEAKMRGWPRNGQNDPYRAGSLELAQQLAADCHHQVVVGFNEFCAPSLDEALDEAARAAAGRDARVVVLTPMMTRGGDHSEREIPNAIGRARGRHPGVRIDYLWPFQVAEISRFLAAQLASVLD